MKKIFLIAIVFLAAISCTKDFEEINTDPTKFTYVAPENIFAGVVERSIDLMADMNKRALWNYSHYLSIEGGQLPRYACSPGDMNGWWDRFYMDILSNLHHIKVLYGEDPLYANRIQMTTIWESYIYWIMVSTWGPIPYTDAFDESVTSYRYDSEELIYTNLLASLKNAEEALVENGDFWAPDKIFANHSILSWKKFAVSLRLKIALQIADANPSLAQEHITEIMGKEDMLVSSSDEDVKAYWGTTEQNFSPYYVDYSYNRVGTGTFPYLSHYLFMYLRSYSDPRIEAYANPSIVPYIVYDTMWVMDPDIAEQNDTVAFLIQYDIPYYGRPKTARLMDCWNLVGISVPMPSSDYMYSEINSQFLPADYFHLIISHVDVSFMKAEIALRGWGGSKTAEEYYYEGIKQSLEQYKVAGGYDAYIARNGIQWETSGTGYSDFRGIVSSSIDGDPMKQIAIQRWIANYVHGGFDAWCLQRRLRAMELPPHFNPGIPTTTSEVAAELPERLPYPNNELILNNGEAQKAIDTYFDGYNNMNGVLYFAKEPVRKDWCSVIPRINNDVVQYYHGRNFEELIASGAEYDTVKAIKKRSLPE